MKNAGRTLTIPVPSVVGSEAALASWRIFQDLLHSNECLPDIYEAARAQPGVWTPGPLELTPRQWLRSLLGRPESNREQLALRYSRSGSFVEVAFAVHVLPRHVLRCTPGELLRCRIRSA